jgi:hypothetical protein
MRMPERVRRHVEFINWVTGILASLVTVFGLYASCRQTSPGPTPGPSPGPQAKAGCSAGDSIAGRTRFASPDGWTASTQRGQTVLTAPHGPPFWDGQIVFSASRLTEPFESRFNRELTKAAQPATGRVQETPGGFRGRFAEGLIPSAVGAYKRPFQYFAADVNGSYEEITFSCDKSCDPEQMRRFFTDFICRVDYTE